MAYVVARPNHRYEIRESRSVGGRSRSRTLATFTVLDDDVLDHAAARAERPFDREAVSSDAVRKGAVKARPRADTLVGRLLIELDAGRRTVPAGLRRLLAAKAAGEPVHQDDHHLDRMLEWQRATDRQRGETLGELLELADAVAGREWRYRYHFPRLVPHAEVDSR